MADPTTRAEAVPLTDEREQEIRKIANAAPLRIMMEDVVGCRVALRELLAEIDRIRHQRRFLIDQLRRKDARSGDGDRALREFLGGEERVAAVPDCLFCRPNTPDNQVIATAGTCYARADNFPAAPGHLEIVPYRHVESLFDLTPAEAADVWRLLREAAAQGTADGWTIGVNEGRAAGRTIDHVHIHLIPRRHGDVPDPRGGVRNVLPGGNPDRWSAAPARTALADPAAALAEDLRYVLGYNGARHNHMQPDVWDTSGKPCGHCARLAAARENLAAYDANPDAVPPEPADRANVLLWAADQIDAETRQAKTDGVLEPDKYRPCRDASAQLRALAAEAAVTPPPALTEEGRLRAQVEVLQQDAERDRGLAKVGARCMRVGHQGLIETARVTAEGWRFALSTALGLGTSAPWDAIHDRAKELGRLADETPAATEQPESCAHCGKNILRISGTLTAWWVHDPGGHTICFLQQAASSPRATPKPAVGARQDGAPS
jgi:diadenosine tetraphosphate (Ap4A) HIT family hydrolase